MAAAVAYAPHAPAIRRPPTRRPATRRPSPPSVSVASRSKAVGARTYRRRRAVAALVIAIGLVLLGWSARAAFGSGSLTAPRRARPAPRVYVVQPGDTLWNVARGLHPQGDLRAVVDRLEASHRGAALEVGERISL